jgi:hypothetical protein
MSIYEIKFTYMKANPDSTFFNPDHLSALGLSMKTLHVGYAGKDRYNVYGNIYADGFKVGEISVVFNAKTGGFE